MRRPLCEHLGRLMQKPEPWMHATRVRMSGSGFTREIGLVSAPRLGRFSGSVLAIAAAVVIACLARP
jgi:hypothetical protein